VNSFVFLSTRPGVCPVAKIEIVKNAKTVSILFIVFKKCVVEPGSCSIASNAYAKSDRHLIINTYQDGFSLPGLLFRSVWF
jgi:hypothetical protein